MGREKNDSERIFEECLTSHGLTPFVYEPPTPGTSSKPDYRLTFGGTYLYFDVKEFEPDASDLEPGFGAFDPYGPIRWKIRDVWKQFQALEAYPCRLVLYNSKKPLVYLTPEIVVGAMLGDLGIQIPFKPGQGLLGGESRQVFTKRGMMIRYEAARAVEPRNLNTSAIIALEWLDVGQRRFSVEVRRVKREKVREPSRAELVEMFEQAQGTFEQRELRVIVCENPYVPKRLPEEMFRGPYDEWYGPADGCIRQLFAGERFENWKSWRRCSPIWVWRSTSERASPSLPPKGAYSVFPEVNSHRHHDTGRGLVAGGADIVFVVCECRWAITSPAFPATL